ncbi:MAG TPA: glycosyltransferase family 4 protein [Candidatus Synoicihabitans sp.]|nr:glycosyltransferase family 4 protein [Candidatus Synoicihabitans sp.]
MGFFLPVPALAGGATEKTWHRLGEALADAGHDVTLISRRWPHLPDEQRCGRLIHLRLPGFDHTRQLWRNLLLDTRWGLRVARALPAGDVVVCHAITLPIYLRWLRPRAGRVSVVLGRMPKGHNRFYGGVDRVYATSAAVADKALAENPRLRDRLRLVPNSIDWPMHAAAVTKGSSLTIGYVGRIHPEKGLEQLLDAALRLAQRSDLPPWRVELTGPVATEEGGGGAAYRDALLARYGAALGQRLVLNPPIFEATKLARHYGQLDVFCYPSLAARGEGLSVAPIEAMAAGAVPVVSRLECYRDLIRPGGNGLQFAQGTANAAIELAEHLATLLRDRDLRLRLATSAQATAREYDHARIAQLLLADFASMLPPSAQTEPRARTIESPPRAS